MKRFKYLTLAALVAFAACDEGEDPVAPVTGTVSGVVTIEGTGASGVTVELSSGQTATTDASGSYSFTDVSAGAYTVSISNLPSDATFSSTSQAATISSAGQVVTVNFDGDFVRTSAILGGVAVSGEGPLEGVTVSIGGGNTTTTDAAGQYSFSGLRAGDYTVSISGFDATQYSFAETSKDVTVGAGESASVSFSGSVVANATVSGSLFLDENPKDDTFTSQVEDKLAAADIMITLEGGGVAVFDTVQTDANGDFSFTDLPAGSYRVEINSTDADIPGNVVFGGTSTAAVVTLNNGESESVFWPFDITQQAVTAAVFYGRDGTDPGVNPLSGITVNAYAQESHAVAGTPVLGTDTTGTDGTVTFRFPRSDDTSPGGGPDQIIFFTAPGPLPADHAFNGERRIELQYASKDSLSLPPDTFDVLTRRANITIRGEDGNGNALSGWNTSWWRNDTTAARIATGTTSMMGVDTLSDIVSYSTLPDTFFVRLSNTQPPAAAGGLTFRQDAVAGRDGMPVNTRTLQVIHNGTQPLYDPLRAGTEVVTYTQMNLLARIHHEADDSTDTAVFTGGDNFTGVTTGVELELYDSTGTSVAGPVSPMAGNMGVVTFPTLPLGSYELRARKVGAASIAVLDDSVASVMLAGQAQADSVNGLTGNAGFSSFAYKYENLTLRGLVQSRNGMTGAAGLRVMIQPTADNIQPTLTDTTVMTGANGVYRIENLREGPYMVMVADSSTVDGPVWSFFDTLTTTSMPLPSGGADNIDAQNGVRDAQGPGATAVANFQAAFMDTEIAGVVVNDRDSDYNTLDPEEALAGVRIFLYEDVDGNGTLDSGEPVVDSTTTDGMGAYSFDQLEEGTSWFVRAFSTDDFTVLRTLSATGSITNTIGPLMTSATVGTGAMLNQNNTRQVGNTDPPEQDDELPRWNYAINAAAPDGGNLGGGTGPNALAGALTTRPTHFIPLYSTGTVTGTIVDDNGDGAAGVTVNVTLCNTAPTVPTSPIGTASGCTTVHTAPSPWIFNTTTDANGEFTIEGLLEGVYEVNISPATGGFGTLIGFDGVATNGDEVPLFSIVGNSDVETVPDYEVN